MKKVIAIARGYYGALREPGEEFLVTDEDFKAGATWFEDVNAKDAPKAFNGAFVGSQPTSEEAAESGIAGTPHNPGDVVNNNVADVQVVREEAKEQDSEAKTAGNTTLANNSTTLTATQKQAAKAGNPGTSSGTRGNDLT